MTLNDLKTGMIVTTRNGNEYTVIRDYVAHDFNNEGDILVRVGPGGENGWMRLREYAENFKFAKDCFNATEWDIVKVEVAPHPYAFMDLSYSKTRRHIMWQEEPPKKLTISEIEKILGYKVEIVSEEE